MEIILARLLIWSDYNWWLMSNNVSSKSKLTLVLTKIITFKSVEEPKIKKFRIITIDLEVIRALNSDR
jgi:hypothetical protein